MTFIYFVALHLSYYIVCSPKNTFVFIEENEQKKKIRSKSIRRIVRHCQNRRRAKPLVVKNGTRDKIIRSVINGRMTLRSTHQEFVTVRFDQILQIAIKNFSSFSFFC